MDTEKTKLELQEFRSEMTKVTRARHPFEIKHFVVGCHEDRWRQWYQICIETDAKWTALQDAEANQQIAKLEIEELEIQIEDEKKSCLPVDRRQEIKIEKLKIELQRKRNQSSRAESYMIGALKEIQDFLDLAKNEYKDFWGHSENELVRNNEIEYWVSRLSKQIAVDILTFGRPQAGNVSVLLQVPIENREEIMRQSLVKADEHAKMASLVEHAYSAEIQRLGIQAPRRIESAR